jgi:hypothetical protein
MTLAGTLLQPASSARTGIWIAKLLKKCEYDAPMNTVLNQNRRVDGIKGHAQVKVRGKAKLVNVIEVQALRLKQEAKEFKQACAELCAIT